MQVLVGANYFRESNGQLLKQSPIAPPNVLLQKKILQPVLPRMCRDTPSRVHIDQHGCTSRSEIQHS